MSNIIKESLTGSEEYTNYREEIRSGDLLIWSNDQNKLLSKIFMYIIRLFLRTEFAHVGIAWVIGDRVLVVEATTPTVRVVPLSDKEEFYTIPMKIKWKKEYDNYLLDTLGLKYSFKNAICAYFGKRKPIKGELQCAELVNDFYRNIGLDLGDYYTPSEIVKQVLSLKNKELRLITF